MLIRDELQIRITPHRLGAALQFPKDRILVASLKARFPRARWGAGTKSWHIPGKLAAHRAQLWADEQQTYLARLEQAARDSEWAAPAPAASPKPAAVPTDADPFGLSWAEWHDLGGEMRIKGRAVPRYTCGMHRLVHELDKAPGFALRLPATGEMAELMRQFDPVQLPITPLWRSGPTPHWMYERKHWFYVPVARWFGLRAVLPTVKAATMAHASR